MSRRRAFEAFGGALRSAQRRALAAGALRSLAVLRRRSVVIVLGYHDLREAGDPSSWLRVPVDRFREHLAFLRRIGTFVDPSEAAPSGRGLRFLVTFDDGYANNARLALPVLEAAGVRALFFVSTHHLLTGEPFWFDRVVLPLQARRVAELDLESIGMGRFRFAPEDGPGRWDDVQTLLAEIKRRDRPGASIVDRVLEAIDRATGGVPAEAAERFRPLRPEELRTMARSPSSRIASHGHRHEILTHLESDPLERSLARSREELETLLGYGVTDLAYPNGDHDDRVERAAREAGYRRAFGVVPGVWRPATDPFAIPRLQIGGYDSVIDVAARINLVLLRDLTSRSPGS